MRRSSGSPYSHISSFDDFRREKELVSMKIRIAETRLSMTWSHFRDALSAGNIVFSLAKEYLLPVVARLFRKDTDRQNEEE